MEITFTAGTLPDGRTLIFLPEKVAEFDPGRLTTYTFTATAKTTGDAVRANGLVYDVLDALDAAPEKGGALTTGAYNAALRIATGYVRCKDFTQSPPATLAPAAPARDLAAFLALPYPVLEKYLYDLDSADVITREDADFFRRTAPQQAEDAVKDEMSEASND